MNLAGYLRAETGVGEAVRASARALEAAEVPHVLNDFLDTWASNIDTTAQGVRTENPYRVNLVHVNADQVSTFVRQKQNYFNGRYNIGFWFWELARFPLEWARSFDWFDEIWVASSFVQDAISQTAPIPVVKMPLALRPQRAIGSPMPRDVLGLPTDRFIFLYVFDFRSVMERKNPLGLIRAFRRAFGARTDVLLVLKTTNGSFATVGQPLFEAAQGAANVRIIDGAVPRAVIDGLIAACDCYVSLHRSEGFGVTIAEAMRFGKPVIATAYSGSMEFTTPGNSLLVQYKLVTLERDFGPYQRGSTWADPDLDHAASLMRHVVAERGAGHALGARAQADVSRLLDPSVVGARMLQRLSRMAGRSAEAKRGVR